MALVLAMPLQAQEVARNYDKFDEFTSFATPGVDLTPHFSVQFSYVCGGNARRCSPRTITMSLYETGSSWSHLDDNDVILLLDGAHRIHAGGANHLGTNETGGVIEYRHVELSRSTIARLTHARTIEGKWSLTEFSLNRRAVATLRTIAASAGDSPVPLPPRTIQSMRDFPESQVAQRARLNSPGIPIPVDMLRQPGEVEVRFIVDTLGRVDPATIEILRSSNPRFTQTVRDGLGRLRYTPAESGEFTVREVIERTLVFVPGEMEVKP
ncbi:MAG: energy transducer TonB [Gemmatimonadaceae bacterium]